MFYQYRQMTPEERAQVVQQRRERGFPLHAPPHPFRHAGNYFITVVNYEHKPIMAEPARRSEIEARLLDELRPFEVDVNAWVVLPNHYHTLVSVKHLDLLSAALKQIHGATARAWNLQDGLTNQRRVWYKFRDRMIRDEAHFYHALNYIHINPVKHGYVQDPYEWPWTSLENYRMTWGRDWLNEKWTAYPPGDFGKGWDD
ncbi:MAG: transposase [Chloroflexi bacterium]|nr:transposase [Chloroflexota bacterium]